MFRFITTFPLPAEGGSTCACCFWRSAPPASLPLATQPSGVSVIVRNSPSPPSPLVHILDRCPDLLMQNTTVGIFHPAKITAKFSQANDGDCLASPYQILALVYIEDPEALTSPPARLDYLALKTPTAKVGDQISASFQRLDIVRCTEGRCCMPCFRLSLMLGYFSRR